MSETFPILDEMVFLNHAGVAPVSGPAARAMHEFADRAARFAYVDSGWHRRARRIKDQAARLLHARGGHEIAYIPNTSTGLALVARGLDWTAGDEAVITAVEYPANRYPWEDLTRRGVKLVEVEQQPDGRIDEEDVIEAVTDRTKVVSISHVQYSTGHRIDLRRIAETVHAAGGYLCVDAIQSVGLMPLEVEAWGVDFLAADGHKWMLGPEGCGIFYCREDLCELLHPAIVGWMGMVDATNFGQYRYELLPDARRFEPGSYNIPGLLALGASVDLLLETGLEQVWSGVEAITAYLSEGLERIGCTIFSPRKTESERSGIVTFDPPPDSLAPAQIVRALEQRGIVIVVREGRLRVSPHFYNTRQQMDRLIEALARMAAA